MKPCPQCGEPLHFVANRWMHVTPARCLLITLLPSPEEITQYSKTPTLPGARYRKADSAGQSEWKFGYLAEGAGD